MGSSSQTVVYSDDNNDGERKGKEKKKPWVETMSSPISYTKLNKKKQLNSKAAKLQNGKKKVYTKPFVAGDDEIVCWGKY